MASTARQAQLDTSSVVDVTINQSSPTEMSKKWDAIMMTKLQVNLKNIILNIFMVPTEFKNLLPNPICGFKFIANGE